MSKLSLFFLQRHLILFVSKYLLHLLKILRLCNLFVKILSFHKFQFFLKIKLLENFSKFIHN